MERENNLLDRLLKNRALSHTLFWLMVLFMAPITTYGGITEKWEAFIFRAVAMPIKMAVTYILVYYQIPELLQKKKYIQFILSFLLLTILLTFIYRINNVHIAETLAGIDSPKESLPQMISEFWATVIGYAPRLYVFTVIFLFIKMIMDRSAEKHQIDILKKEKATAELNFLKAQIHPHFLFNTLNNLYSLTLDKSDKAPDVVAKLSEMLDYMLYQCSGDQVLVNKEVALLEHYIDLEKLRYGDRLNLSFDYNIKDPQATIAPLILLSIVENAFKHGVSGTIQHAIIQISLRVKNDSIHFRVYNTKPSVELNGEKSYKEGVGMKNILRQLELIYPKQYQWDIKEQDESYEVNLWIKT